MECTELKHSFVHMTELDRLRMIITCIHVTYKFFYNGPPGYSLNQETLLPGHHR